MFQTKFVEKIKTHFMLHNFVPKIVPFEIMWKNMVQPDRPQMAICYGAEKMRFACRITKTIIDRHT
jgi:hypothetical protein